MPKSAKATAATQETATETPVKDLLDQYGFSYEMVNLDLSKVNRLKSQRNQARISKPIDEDQVIVYGQYMKEGATFPPIVVYESGDGFIVMDGNHRVGAADLNDLTHFPAYLVKAPSSAQVTTFTYEANTRHGLPTSLKDRIEQAIHLVEQQAKAVDVAKRLGIPEQALRHAIDLHEATKRFSGLGIKKFDRLSPTSRRRLDTIPNDVVLRAAADLVIDATIGGDDLVKFVREINSIKSSEAAQLAVVKAWRETRTATIKATAGGRIKVPQPLTTFSRVTSIVNRTNVDTLSRHFTNVSADVREEYVKAAAASVEKLMEIIRALRKVETQA